MATKTLALTAVTAVPAADGVLTSAEMEDILKSTTWAGKTLAEMKAADAASVVASTATNTITVKGLGVLNLTITMSAGIAVTFEADAALAGNIDFAGTRTSAAKDYTFSTINLAKTTAGVTAKVMGGDENKPVNLIGGAGDDQLTTAAGGRVLVGGAGNDTLTVGYVGSGATLTGGLGADVFNVATASATVVIEDYTYTQGDVIWGDGAATLAGNGQYAVSADTILVTSTIAKVGEDSLYKIKVADKNGKKAKEYWTVDEDSYVAVRADGSGVKDAMVLTGGGAKSDTLISGAGNDVIKVGAVGADVWAGAGDDSITLDTSGKGTVWFGSMDGNDEVANFVSDTTVINLYDSTISDLSVAGAGANYTFTVGSSTLKLSGAGTVTNTINNWKFKEKGGDIKKVSADVSGGQTLTAVQGAESDVYIGKFSASGVATVVDYATIGGGSELAVNLYNTGKYKNIAGIVAASSAADAVYIGAADKATTIDARNANANATNMQIWGGGRHNDSIVLDSIRGVSQTVWFGAGDGEDSVSNFDMEFKDKDDVIYLYDTADVKTIDFAATDNTSLDIKVGNATLHTDVAGGSGRLQLKDSTGKINKVWYIAEASTRWGVVAADDADYVVATDAAVADGARAGVAYTSAMTTDLVVNLMDTSRYKNITNIHTQRMSAGVTAIGTGEGSRIDLGTGNNAVWGGGAGSDTIGLNGGKTEVWYGGSADGQDKVGGFNSDNDRVYFWDASLQDVVRNAAFSGDGASEVALTFSDKNSLMIGPMPVSGASLKHSIAVKDNTGATTKLMVSDTGMTFSADTKAYVSTAKTGGTLSLGADAGDVTLYLDNIYATTGNAVNDIYLKGITELDARAGFGNYVLIGAGATADKLKGGKGTTTMWGGGAASDMMTGNSGVDAVWFGSGDGTDIFEAANVEDKVVLWSAAAISDIEATYGGGGALTISTAGGDKLVISSADEAALGQLTFQVGTDDVAAAKYTFDTKAKAFKAK